MNPIKVGLLGIGTVGSGTFNVLKRNAQEIQRRAGRGIEISMVADLDTARAKAVVPLLTRVEVECDTLDQVREAARKCTDLEQLEAALDCLSGGFEINYSIE